jgi:hypothetical protein
MLIRDYMSGGMGEAGTGVDYHRVLVGQMGCQPFSIDE